MTRVYNSVAGVDTQLADCYARQRKIADDNLAVQAEIVDLLAKRAFYAMIVIKATGEETGVLAPTPDPELPVKAAQPVVEEA